MTPADPAVAVARALATATADLDGVPAVAALVFAGPSHDLGRVLAAARRVTGVPVLGCTTAGEFVDTQLTHGGIAIALIGSDDLLCAHAVASGLHDDADGAAARLCAPYAAAALEARHRGLPHATTVLLLDGLSGVGDELVRAVMAGTRPFQQIVGGAAGDEGQFAATRVGTGDRADSDTAAALHVFGPRPWGIGVGHGLTPTTGRMVVTRAEGNTVFEVDGRPAFDIYREHAAAHGVELSRADAGRYMIANELGVYFLDELHHARAPLAVGEGDALVCAAPIAAGSSVCILDGEPAAMIAAARAAAVDARARLEGATPAGALVFDCVCRGLLLGDGFARELEAVREVMGGAPVAGFLTYGEIARYRGRMSGWHNTSAVVVAIPR